MPLSLLLGLTVMEVEEDGALHDRISVWLLFSHQHSVFWGKSHYLSCFSQVMVSEKTLYHLALFPMWTFRNQRDGSSSMMDFSSPPFPESTQGHGREVIKHHIFLSYLKQVVDIL